MIEVYYKNNNVKNFKSLTEISGNDGDIFGIRLIDYSSNELKQFADKFDLELSIFSKKEDIEISSHYIESSDQLSFNFSIPDYSDSDVLSKQEVYMIIKDNTIFSFLSSKFDEKLNHLTHFRYDFDNLEFDTFFELFFFKISIISDYFADLVELLSNKIKHLYIIILKSKQFSDKDFDTITELNFHNILVKESLNQLHRILLLLKRNKSIDIKVIEGISRDIDDLSVIQEHIHYNFDRLDDLKENINSKIELEQNRIFKTLTIITVCITIPTLIAGIYGMNFQNMPEIKWEYGYPAVIVLIVLSLVFSIIYFKKKKWF